MGVSDIFHNLLFKPKNCPTCGAEIDFRIIIGYNINKSLDPREEKSYCINHGVSEFSRLLREYKGFPIFVAPEARSVGGSFFYTPDELRIHGYDSKDKAFVQGLISKIREDSNKTSIGWISLNYSDGIKGERHFSSGSALEIISRDNLVKKFQEFINKLSLECPKGEYWITEPRGDEGIFLFDDQI